VFFVAGRKGSGKSTFIKNFHKMDKESFKSKYKTITPLSAEAFQHDDAYGNLFVGSLKDKTHISPYDLLSLFWQVYFVLQSIVTIGVELEIRNIKEDDARYLVFDKTTKRLKTKIGLKRKQRYLSIRKDNVPKLIFSAAVELIKEQYNNALDDMQGDELFLTSFSSRFTAQDIIENLLGEDLTYKYIDALSKCKKRILISLDGFDTHSGDFRRTTNSLDHDSEEYKYRSEYEVLFYRTLIEVVTSFKNETYNDNHFILMWEILGLLYCASTRYI